MTLTPHIGPRVRMNPLMFAKLLRALNDGPSTRTELLQACGASATCLRTYLQHLRREKLVRIAGWDKSPNGSCSTPAYEWAPDKRDAPPASIPANERSRSYRARKREAALREAIAAPTSVVL